MITLNVAFNSFTNTVFAVENPLVIPKEGAVIDFAWEEFLEDKSLIRQLNDYEGIWFCNIVSTKYYRNSVDMQVVLFEEKDYQKEFSK